MVRVWSDGSAGDANSAVIGRGYTHNPQPEFRFVAASSAALGNAATVLNVGAGTVSYESTDREVTVVAPSAAMRTRRPPSRPSAIDAVAERLPFPDASVDAGMATFTVHQWHDLVTGLREMRRVTRGPIIMTCDPDALDRSWLAAYAPEMIAVEARRHPPVARIAELLGSGVDILALPVPLDSSDGFSEAYYGRPERLLDPGARLAIAAWSFVDPVVVALAVEALRTDLASGAWDARYGHLRTQPEFDGSLWLIARR